MRLKARRLQGERTRRLINSSDRPGVLGRVVWRKHPPSAESVQGWEGQQDSVSSEKSRFSLEKETARFRREVEKTKRILVLTDLGFLRTKAQLLLKNKN